jgi:hypothetical protein
LFFGGNENRRNRFHGEQREEGRFCHCCKQAGVMLATFLFAGATLAQTPDVKPERIRGDIVSLQGDILTAHRRSGDTVLIEVKPDVGAISLSDVKRDLMWGGSDNCGQ